MKTKPQTKQHEKASEAPEAPQFTEHDCPKCGEHFSTCICPTIEEGATLGVLLDKHAQDITYLWPDELKHSLATVVSLVARHASARESAAWSHLWAHLESAEALAEALRELSRLVHQNNALQHAGLEVSPEAWGEMYQVTNQAKAALAQWEASQ